MNLKLLNFQNKAVGELRSEINKLWQREECTQLILHSPTGSGKTLMTCALIDSMQNVSPEDIDLGDVAYFWITLNNELAMQSKEKFRKYFFPNLRNKLSTFDDCDDTLASNEVLFVNWQKLSQDKKKKRLLLRRPSDEYEQKENGFYFEDLMENTAKAGRRIVMVIDESHSNVNTANSQDIIKIINPKLIIKVSATPFKTEIEEKMYYGDCFEGKAAIVKVDERDVVDEGLIKEEIVCQTEEDLNRFGGGDIDNTMLALAKQKRDSLLNEWRRMGYDDINPLVLIQLPNDEDESKAEGKETKEEFTRRVLKQNYGVDENRIVTWLADKPLKPEWRISDNDSPIDYLIFKYAAGTGWDCPRAHILVMFREIKSPVFHKQTLGRIKRMAVNGLELQDSVMLRRGYLYTTYKTNEVNDSFGKESTNKPKTQKTQLDERVKHKAIETTIKTEIIDLFTNSPSSYDDIDPIVEEWSVAESIAKEAVKIWNEESEKIGEEQLDIDSSDNYPTVYREPLPGYEGGGIPRLDIDISGIKTSPRMYIQKAIESKAKSVSDSIAKRAEEIANTKIPDYVRHEIAATAQIAIETKIGRRESELVLDPALKTQYMSRVDFGDLGKSSVFQEHFLKSMHNFFGTKGNKLGYTDDRDCLTEAGLELEVSPHWEIKVGKVYRFGGKKDEEGTEKSVSISNNDVSRMFDRWCYDLLKEIKGGNVSRSYATLSQAVRQWFTQLIVSPYITEDQWRRIFVYDCQRESNSVFRNAIASALKSYQPILDEWIKKREAEAQKANEPFRIKTQMAFDDTYIKYEPSDKSMQQPFYLKGKYKGKDNETNFIRMLEDDEDVMNWYKNGNSGKENLAIAYTTNEGERKLFFPDWIVLYTNGDIGIYDTKSGFTSVEKSTDTQRKLEALRERIKIFNEDKSKTHYFRGGIYQPKEGGWTLLE